MGRIAARADRAHVASLGGLAALPVGRGRGCLDICSQAGPRPLLVLLDLTAHRRGQDGDADQDQPEDGQSSRAPGSTCCSRASARVCRAGARSHRQTILTESRSRPGQPSSHPPDHDERCGQRYGPANNQKDPSRRAPAGCRPAPGSLGSGPLDERRVATAHDRHSKRRGRRKTARRDHGSAEDVLSLVAGRRDRRQEKERTPEQCQGSQARPQSQHQHETPHLCSASSSRLGRGGTGRRHHDLRIGADKQRPTVGLRSRRATSPPVDLRNRGVPPGEVVQTVAAQCGEAETSVCETGHDDTAGPTHCDIADVGPGHGASKRPVAHLQRFGSELDPRQGGPQRDIPHEREPDADEDGPGVVAVRDTGERSERTNRRDHGAEGAREDAPPSRLSDPGRGLIHTGQYRLLGLWCGASALGIGPTPPRGTP